MKESSRSKFNWTGLKKIQFIQVYAPTTNHSDEEIEDIYEKVHCTATENKYSMTIIIGDFNAKIGTNNSNNERCMGNFCSGTRNNRGEQFIDFANHCNLKIANTFFKKKMQRRWTWRSPNDMNKNEIDYFLTDKIRNIKDVSAINQVNSGSFRRKLKNKFDQLDDLADINNWNEKIVNIVKTTATETVGKKHRKRSKHLLTENYAACSRKGERWRVTKTPAA